MKPRSILVAWRRIIAAQVCGECFSSFRRGVISSVAHCASDLNFQAGIVRSQGCVPECSQLGLFESGVSRKSGRHKTSHKTGGNLVLTFFEYLKQRAYESILEGAQEAVDFLEAKKDRSTSLAEATLANRAAPMAPSREDESSTTAKLSAAEKTPSPDTEKALPPPRRRGRPRKEPRNDG